jgi:transposase
MSRKRTSIAGIDHQQLDQELRRTKDVREKERLTVLKMASHGEYTLQMMADAVGRARSIIQQWLHKYHQGGLEALLERKSPPGRKPRLNAKVRQAIKQKLDSGTWRTAQEMQRWLEEHHQIQMGLGGCYYWLGKHGGHLKVPRPKHREQKADKLEHFKTQGWSQQLSALEIPAGKAVEFWVMDESRFGLHSIVRRCWATKGVRVVKPFQQRFEWEYLYGALNLTTGAAVPCFLPTVSKEATWVYLQELVKTRPEAHHVILWDGAGFHQLPTGQDKEQWPQLEQVHVIKLPAYSPELNPVEKWWDILKDSVCNRVFDSLEELRSSLEPKLREFWETPEKVLSLLGNNWLCQKANSGYRPIIPLFN